MFSSRRVTVPGIQPASMTVASVLLLLVSIWSPATAGRNTGGAMVLHVDNAVTYSAGVSYCSADPLPATCADLITNVTKDPSVEAMVWMVAAFLDNSSPGVTAFQVGIAGDVPADYYTAFAPCGPGVLEIPDAMWPDPGTGTACAFGAPVYDRLFKMYWFAVTAPGAGSSISTTNYPRGDPRAEWADDSDPPLIDYCYNFGRIVWGSAGQNQCPGSLQSGACCFADGTCQDLLADDCGAAGGTFEGVGTTCATFQCPPPQQACCFADGSCQDLTSDECTRLGGSPQGPGSYCAGVTCPPPPQACCLADGSCQDLASDECTRLGGSPQGPGSYCAGVTCPPPPPTGACCLVCDVCQVLARNACIAQGGTYQGDGTLCDPNPCTSSGPAQNKISDEKEWHGNWAWVRSTFPECAPDPGCNDTCDTAQGMACGDVISPAYLNADNLDWYTWSMNAGEDLWCGTDVVNSGDQTDTYIELYASDCTTLLAQDDDSGPGFYSLISNFIAPYTGRYNLKVRGYVCLSQGPYRFFVSCATAPPPPPNDLCSGAFEIPRCSTGSLQGDNAAYHNDYDPGADGCSSQYPEQGKDSVYYVNLQPGDLLDMTYTQFNFDAAFYIVTDCSNVPGSCVAGADNTLTGEPEVIHYVASATGTYYIILDSYGTDTGGSWSLDYNFSCAAPQACCFPDYHCEMQLPADCRAMGGTPQGSGTNCDTVMCMVTPTERTTWGHIKSLYRDATR